MRHYLEINGDNSAQSSDKIVEKSMHIPIPTFPPTAVIYSMSEKPAITDTHRVLNNSNIVSAGLVAEVLEKREIHRKNGNLCLNCKQNPSLLPTHRDYASNTIIDMDNGYKKDETIIV